jgi:hypothetical protein
VTLLAVTAIAALVACHGESDTKAAPRRAATPVKTNTRDFARATVDAGTARASIDYTAGRTHLHGEGVVDLRSWAASAAIDGGHKSHIQEIAQGNTLYLAVPSEVMVAKTQPEWAAIKLDEQGIAQAVETGVEPSALLNGATSPLLLISAASAVSARAEGTGTVRGTKTRRYRATADLQSIAKSTSPNLAAAASVLEDVTGARTLTFDIWVDAKEVVRRLRLHMSNPASVGVKTKKAVGTVTIDFYDFGVQAHVAAPPAAQVRHPEPAPISMTTTPPTMPVLPPAVPVSLANG